jgi:uncharacterized protein
MKRFAIIAHDHIDASDKRLIHLAAHLEHVTKHLDRYAVAGPLRDTGNADGVIAASLLIVKADSAAEARTFLETDPYFHAGVWRAIEIYDFNAVAGDWVGGKAWG